MAHSYDSSGAWAALDTAVAHEPADPQPEPDLSGASAPAVTHYCAGLGRGTAPHHAPADYILVSGCNEYGHINVRYYCEDHWQTIIKNAGGQLNLKLTCWKCNQMGRHFHKADDYVVEHV